MFPECRHERVRSLIVVSLIVEGSRRRAPFNSDGIEGLGSCVCCMSIKLDSVASSIATVSGRAMIEALIDGERRPAVLADLARGRMRSKIPDLTLALEGRFGAHHALMCQLYLEHIDHLDDLIARLDAHVRGHGHSSKRSPSSARSAWKCR